MTGSIPTWGHLPRMAGPLRLLGAAATIAVNPWSAEEPLSCRVQLHAMWLNRMLRTEDPGSLWEGQAAEKAASCPSLANRCGSQHCSAHSSKHL